jgi:putative transcriptional regulator
MKNSDFQLLVTSVRQAGEIKRGKMQPAAKIEVRPEDVKAIRSKLRKSQSEFALMIGVSVSTLQNWEQGRRQPEGPARALLRVASINPSAVAAALDAVHGSGKPVGSVHPPKNRGKLASDIVIEDRR